MVKNAKILAGLGVLSSLGFEILRFFSNFAIFAKIVKISKIATRLGDLSSLAFESFAIFVIFRNFGKNG